VRDLEQLHGKELSFNNLIDVDAAVLAVSPWPERPACVIIKHTTPCGIALGRSAAEAYARALADDQDVGIRLGDRVQRHGDRAAAEAMQELFVEVVVAPAFADDALACCGSRRTCGSCGCPAPTARRRSISSAFAGGFSGPGSFPATTQWTKPAGRWPTKRRPLV